MKIVWLVNIPLSDVNNYLKLAPLPYGGWLENSSSLLVKLNGIELFILFPL